VAAFAVFHGTQTGPGGPGGPTGNTIAADYVYAMQFDGDRMRHMTKIWNDTISLQQLGVGVISRRGGSSPRGGGAGWRLMSGSRFSQAVAKVISTSRRSCVCWRRCWLGQPFPWHVGSWW